MKAIAITRALPTDHPDCFMEIEHPLPSPGPHDLLIEIKAIALNPVDTKVRLGYKKSTDQYKILGWDASGIVQEIGEKVNRFKPGDEVFYAGELNRDGCNAEYQLVDERIAAHKPKILNFEQAAALPLTSVTAWESLFDRLALPLDKAPGDQDEVIMIIGGAGGVGSIATQLAKQLTDLSVITTSSRPESEDWCKKMGADQVINHLKPLLPQLQKKNLTEPGYIFCLYDPVVHWENLVESIKPQGRICALVDSSQPLDINMLKRKSVTFCWEFMFTRTFFQTKDMNRQGQILANMADLVDSGKIQTTHGRSLGKLSIKNIVRGHRLLEAGHTIGKLTLTVE